MQKCHQIVTIFGGTGFLGRYVVRKLAQAGFIVRVAVRHPERGIFLKTMGEIGQIDVIRACVTQKEDIERALQGATYVVNCVGILFPQKGQRFEEIHAQTPQFIAEIAAKKQIKRFVHVSSLGADLNAAATYLRTKAEGEKAAFEAFPDTVVIRPSVLFGFEDQFLNRFAKMMAFWRVAPLIGGGKNTMQPVYVGDVASAIVQAICLTDLPEKRPQIFELGGPEIFPFCDLQQKIADAMHKNVLMFSIPYWMAQLAAYFLQMISGRILTVDQVKMLKKDNVTTGEHPGFKDLGLKPCSFEDWLSVTLTRFFSSQRTHPFSTLS